jgi:hypothetical protein
MKKILMALAVAVSLLATNNVNVLAGTEDVSPLMTFNFTDNTEILGLTARDSLGKRTGTLKEYAASVAEDIMSYAVFPANYFNAYDDVKEVIGGIYSQGRIVYDSWMDWGCGFDADNKFYLFSLISTISNEGGKIVVKDGSGNDVEIVTAFNCYPWLIKDGEPLDFYSFRNADPSFLDSSLQRAFIGQKADGTFLYGMVGATMTELQTICAELGLVNAVNTDGGASCGVYSNGEYLAVPGRELASAVYIAENRPEITVLYNGSKIEFTRSSMERNGYVFYPLEDILQAFSGGHGWDGETFTVSGELNGNKVEIPLRSLEYRVNGAKLEVPPELLPFIENERTYVYLDFIVEGLGLTVSWDSDTKTISIK